MNLFEEDQKLNFESFLKTTTRLSESSVLKYSQAIFRSIRSWASSTDIEVFEANQVTEKIEFIKRLPIFVKNDIGGNRMYNSSLNHYGNFVKNEFSRSENSANSFERIIETQKTPFARTLFNFCRLHSSKPSLEEFLKKKEFGFSPRDCFRSIKVRFNNEGNYVRIYAPLKSSFSIDDGRRILKEKFRTDLDFTIQEHKDTDVLHPYIETPQQCEDLIDWLSSSPDSKKEKRRLADRKKPIKDYFEGNITDINREMLGRAEQAWLRTYLLNDKHINVCAICGKDFQNDFLVAAHIKRRAECSPKEKKHPSIGMLLCRFGCDELYERGYLVISEEGKVVINKKCEGNSASSYLDSVVNRNCTNWNNSTERFFAWHRKWHSQ